MAVVKLRTRKTAQAEAGLVGVRQAAMNAAESGAPVDVVSRVVHLIDRELSSRSGWSFVMVEPTLYADVIEHLTKESRRPHKAVVLFTRLFSTLPPDGNEVMADREELARIVGCSPSAVSEIMGELKAVGAIYRRKKGRAVRYFVNPVLGTHLGGAARDIAQAEAPELRLLQGGKA